MSEHAIAMSRENSRRMAVILTSVGITVEPCRSLGGGETIRCSKAGAIVFLSTSQPDHWTTASDERKDLVVVAAVGDSILAFWKRPAENRLRDEIMAALKSLQWTPPQMGMLQ